jgi:hypothetical protein
MMLINVASDRGVAGKLVNYGVGSKHDRFIVGDLPEVDRKTAVSLCPLL